LLYHESRSQPADRDRDPDPDPDHDHDHDQASMPTVVFMTDSLLLASSEMLISSET
jgi:hypothetical protein